MEYGKIESSSGPSDVAFVGDVDGDGIQDVAIGEGFWSADGVNTTGRVVIGSVDQLIGNSNDLPIAIVAPEPGWYLGYAIAAIGDENGDGLDDILVSSTGGVVATIVSGISGGKVNDLAITHIYGDTSGTGACRIGDVDGDGRDDVAITDSLGVAIFMNVGGSPSWTMSDPSFHFSWTETGGSYGVLSLGDIDGDDLEDLFIPQAWSVSGTQRAWVLLGSEIFYRGTKSSDESTLSAIISIPSALFGYSYTLAGDVDGDGHPDIVLGGPDYSAGGTHAGGAVLIPLPQ